MAEALSFFFKRFSRAYDLEEWRVFASYDPKVTSKYVPSRKYGNAPGAIAQEAFAEFEKQGAGYGSVAELVLDRTDAESEVSGALRQDARQASMRSRAQDEEGLDRWAGSLELLRVGFVADAEFRMGFEDRLRDDFTGQDLDAFWLSIDRLLDEIESCDLRFERGKAISPQRDIVASFVLASLLGARDYRQDFGRKADRTPPASDPRKPSASAPVGFAQLLAIVRTGEGAADYQTAPADSGRTAYSLDPARRARIGRERAWCEGEGEEEAAVASDEGAGGAGGAGGAAAFQPVVVSARYASRQHAELYFKDGSWWLEDVSTYGTLITRAGTAGTAGGARAGAGAAGASGEERLFVNGETVELRHGDLICLAPVQNREMIGPRYLCADPSCKNFRFELAR